MAYQAAVFDLDGTLLDTLDDLADGVNITLAHYGYPRRTREEIRSFVGNGVRLLVSRSLPSGEETPQFEEIFAYFKNYYSTHSRVKTAPYPGILAMLEELRRRGIFVAVVSNKLESAVRDLCSLFFGDLVTVAIGDLDGRPRKPAPDGTLAALASLGVSAADAVYIGDSDVDVETAHNAGLPCIAVLWGFRDAACLKNAGADFFAADSEELLSLLLSK